MNGPKYTHRRRQAFTMVELMVAMVASTFLLAGLGATMYIARQTAYAPTAAARRAKTADIVNLISDELRYATIITQQTPQILEFTVADRNNDGSAERIRYEWSGTAGDPLRKTINGGTAVDVLTSVYAFTVTLQQKAKTTTLTTTTDSAEAVLLSNTNVIGSSAKSIDNSNQLAQQITISGMPANALYWNATKLDFYGQQNGGTSETLRVRLCPSGDPNDEPNSNSLGQVDTAENLLTASMGWNTVIFPTPVRGLTRDRTYAIVWSQSAGSGTAAQVRYDDTASSGVLDSTDGGASWQFMKKPWQPTIDRQMFYRLYGTFTTPGPSYSVTRNNVSYVRLAVQSGNQSHARVDTSIPLRNSPELLAAYWRCDFDRNPIADSNGDSVSDWATGSGGAFDTANLVNGVWTAAGTIESRPKADFATTTIVEARCRNTSIGGNGAVIAIYADRQASEYAPLLVYVQKQADGTQTLTLNGKTNDSTTKQLFTLPRLGSGFVRVRLTILPQNHVVNLQINDEDQGTFSYPRYAPTSTNDRYLTLYADTSTAEFDYIDLRAGTN